MKPTTAWEYLGIALVLLALGLSAGLAILLEAVSGLP